MSLSQAYKQKDQVARKGLGQLAQLEHTRKQQNDNIKTTQRNQQMNSMVQMGVAMLFG